MPSTRDIPQFALYTALVAVATLIFTIYVPATRGYFNVGESAVFLVALLAGSRAGAFAGGVGSMIADIALGYYFFAPATLIIKGAEGGLLGFLSSRRPSLSPGSWKALSAAIAVAIGASIFAVGSIFYSGESELSLGLPFVGQTVISVSLNPYVWGAVGAACSIFILFIAAFRGPEVGWTVLSAAASGLVMVSGYFLYEQLILGYAAAAEVPFNVGQVLVGIAISLPAYKSLRAIKRFNQK
jgi:uncharacterized membrane protein